MENKQKTSKKILVGRTSNWFKLYNFLDYEIKKVFIFNEKGVLFEKDRGWFEDTSKKNDIASIEITEPVRKLKVNFQFEGNFVLPVKKERYERNTGKKAHLYIHEKDAQIIKVEKKVIDFETDTEIRYEDRITIKIEDHEFVETCNYISEDKPFGNLVKETAKRFEELGIEISTYDTEKLLIHYNLEENKHE